MSANSQPGDFLQTTMGQLQAAMSTLQLNATAFKDLQTRNAELALALQDAEAERDVAYQRVQSLEKQALCPSNLSKVHDLGYRLGRFETIRALADGKTPNARHLLAGAPNANAQQIGPILQELQERNTRMEEKVAELENDKEWMGPLVKVGIAVRIGTLALAAKKLCGDSWTHPNLDQYIMTGEHAARMGNVEADGAIFKCRSVDHRMWLPAFRELYDIPETSFCSSMNPVYNFEATVSLLCNSQVYIKKDGPIRNHISCVRKTCEKYSKDILKFEASCSETERATLKINRDEITKFTSVILDMQKMLDAEAEVQKNIDHDEKINELHDRIAALEYERNIVKPLVDIGVAVRRRKMQKDILGRKSATSRAVLKAGNEAAHNNNIHADTAALLLGHGSESDESCFQIIYGRKLPDSMQELEIALELEKELGRVDCVRLTSQRSGWCSPTDDWAATPRGEWATMSSDDWAAPPPREDHWIPSERDASQNGKVVASQPRGWE